jgi:hypothetical protein
MIESLCVRFMNNAGYISLTFLSRWSRSCISAIAPDRHSGQWAEIGSCPDGRPLARDQVLGLCLLGFEAANEPEDNPLKTVDRV